MKRASSGHGYRSLILILLFISGVAIGLGAQETPYVVYGPLAQYGGNDNSSHYDFADVLTAGDICYFLRRDTHVGLVISSTSYSVGYLMPGPTPNYVPDADIPDRVFFTRLSDSAVLGKTRYNGFKWTTFNGETGQTTYPLATFQQFSYSPLAKLLATAMDSSHVLVVFHNSSSVAYATCMDLDYNELWGFSLADIDVLSGISFDQVFALDTQRFILVSSANQTTQLFILNSSGVVENHTNVTGCSRLFQTNIPGTLLMITKQSVPGNDILSKLEGSSIIPLMTLNNVQYDKIIADADANSIVVLNQNSNETIELKKYDWEGNLIWSRPVPWRWINTTTDNLAISNSGSIFFSMRDITQERSVLVKVLADGSNSYTANDDPIEVPIIPSLSVYPNPFRNVLNVSIDKGEGAELTIFNSRGQVIRKLLSPATETSAQNWSWDGKDAIGNDVPNGVYLIRVKSRNGIQQSKCLKLQ